MKARQLAQFVLFLLFAVGAALPRAETARPLDRLAAPAGAADGQASSGVFNDTFYCGFDWDGDGNTTNDAGDLVLCLDAAKLKAGNREDGTDSSVIVQLPAGVFDICAATTCPYRLQGGLSIRGTNARTKADPTIKPTAAMDPNGGTWLRGTTTETMFYGEDVLNLEIQDVGFTRFKVALQFGKDDVMGASWSRFENLFFNAQCIGSCDSTALLFYNGLKNVIDGVFGDAVTYGLRIIAQNDLVQPSNLVISSVVFVCYIDEPNRGCIEVTLEPGAETGCSQSQNYVTFVRPQVAVQSTLTPAPPGLSGMRFANHPQCFATQNIVFMTVVGADIEGLGMECGFDLIDVAAGNFELAGTSPDGLQYHFCVDANSKHNILTSAYDRTRARIDDTTSMLFGQFRSIARSDGAQPVFGGLVNDTTRRRQTLVLGGRPLWWEPTTGGWSVANSFPPAPDGSNTRTIRTFVPPASSGAPPLGGQVAALPQHWLVAAGADTPGGAEIAWSPGTERAGAVLLFPLIVDRRTEFDRIGIAVESAGARGERIRLGLYASEPGDGAVPGERLFVSAPLTPLAAGDLSFPIDAELVPGRYFLAVQFDAQPSARYDAVANGAGCPLGRKSLSAASDCAVAWHRDGDFDEGLPARLGPELRSVAGPVLSLGLRVR